MLVLGLSVWFVHHHKSIRLTASLLATRVLYVVITTTPCSVLLLYCRESQMARRKNLKHTFYWIVKLVLLLLLLLVATSTKNLSGFDEELKTSLRTVQVPFTGSPELLYYCTGYCARLMRILNVIRVLRSYFVFHLLN